MFQLKRIKTLLKETLFPRNLKLPNLKKNLFILLFENGLKNVVLEIQLGIPLSWQRTSFVTIKGFVMTKDPYLWRRNSSPITARFLALLLYSSLLSSTLYNFITFLSVLRLGSMRCHKKVHSILFMFMGGN